MPVVSLNIPEGELRKLTFEACFWLIAVGGNVSVEGFKQINHKNVFFKTSQ